MKVIATMTQSARLLIVDDEETNRDVLARRLRRQGFEVVTAENGDQAIEMVHGGDVDLVLLDSMMPGLNGVQVLTRLRETYTADSLPIIMVTAVAESQRIAEALELGANDYVTKPVDFPVALARIRSQLSRQKAERALRQSEERYALAARGANDGLWDWNLRTNEVYYSDRWKTMLGYADGDVGASPEEWFSRVHADDLDRLRTAIDGHLQHPSEPFECEYRIRHQNGSYLWMLGRGLSAGPGPGGPGRMAGSQSDITNRKTTDPLTGLPNRLLFEERVATALLRQKANCDYSFAVLFLDLDRFKLVNDGLGHVAGDALLLQVADRLRNVVRDSSSGPGRDLVARLGGDEFAILIDRSCQRALLGGIADRILASFRRPFLVETRTLFCSVSIGIAVAHPGCSSPQDIVREADTAMYAAKGAGKDRWAIFDEAMRDRVTSRLQIETELRLALPKNQLFISFQPRVELATGDVCGCEALVRWRHPQHGVIPPGVFVPVAEETGLIHEIGLWVLRQACLQLNSWHQKFPLRSRLSVAVNVSPVQCREPGFVTEVAGILRETAVAPANVHLEITESVLLENIQEARHILHELKTLGVGLKLDDFGTGYSCLKYLSVLPFDMLKIDRSFTAGLQGESGETAELVRTILAMAHNLNLEVVAEGIETAQHLSTLQGMGCEFGQGYLFSRPTAPADVEELLRSGGVPGFEAACTNTAGAKE